MNKKLLRLGGIIVILVFGSSYIMSLNGYDEYYQRQRVLITSEKIKEFEEDVANNQNIDIKDYMVNDVNYTNDLSNFVYGISDYLFTSSRKIVRNIFRRLNYLVQDS